MQQQLSSSSSGSSSSGSGSGSVAAPLARRCGLLEQERAPRTEQAVWQPGGADPPAQQHRHRLHAAIGSANATQCARGQARGAHTCIPVCSCNSRRVENFLVGDLG